ncbi:MAG: hypothetical protein QME32_07080 [Endomicrobiia bacterium]|nr:hypothetical protein [Endomicrobiia bacterium]
MKKIHQSVHERRPSYKIERNTITIPIELFETAESKEEIEDWLLAHDAGFIARMRKAKADMLAGKGKTLEEVKKKLCMK